MKKLIEDLRNWQCKCSEARWSLLEAVIETLSAPPPFDLADAIRARQTLYSPSNNAVAVWVPSKHIYKVTCENAMIAGARGAFGIIDICDWQLYEEPVLNQLLKKAAHHEMTPYELWHQRVSWVYGQSKGTSREEVERRATEMYGPCPDAGVK